MLVRIWLWPNEHQFYFLNICQHLVQNLGHHISQHLCQLPGQHLSQIFYQHSGQYFLLSSWLVPFSKFHITEKTVLLHTYIQTDMSKLESCFATKNNVLKFCWAVDFEFFCGGVPFPIFKVRFKLGYTLNFTHLGLSLFSLMN